MSTIVTRAGKGSPLTNNEVDANFTNLNSDKYQSGDSPSFAQVTVDNILVNGNTISSTDTNGNIVLSPNGSGTVDVASSKITGLLAPTASTDAATKQYVDEIAEGIKSRPSVRAATTTNLAANYNNGTAGVGATLTADTNRVFGTLDGVTSWAITTPPQGVLVKNQTNAAHNGRYNLTSLGEAGVSPWVLTRCGLCDQANEIPGSYTFVVDGTVNEGTGWVQTVTDPATFVMGTDPIFVTQFSGAGTYTAGTGLSLTGTQFAVSLVPVANGGTGQTTANAALNAFLPSQATNANKYLRTDGTNTSWQNVPSPNNGTLTLAVSGSGLSGSASFTADQAGNSTFTVTSNATSTNTLNALVVRDGSGNFSAGTITAALTGNVTGNVTGSSGSCTGNAATATTLQTARTINGVSFNGSANITVTATANNALTLGSYLTGTSYNGSAAVTAAVDATSANTANKVVARDGSGGFSAGAVSVTSLTASGDITSNSDERLKTNWRPVQDDFVAKLAGVKSGVYDRTDIQATQAGVSAQSLEEVLAEVVMTAPDGIKSVNYGNAALVAAIELAKQVVELRKEIAALKGI
jgi:hypothetical protein